MSIQEGHKNTVTFRFWKPGMGGLEQIEVVDLSTRRVVAVTLEQRKGANAGLKRRNNSALSLGMVSQTSS